MTQRIPEKETNSSAIRTLRPDDSDKAADLFVRELGRSFVGGLGKTFLARVYLPFLRRRYGEFQLVFLSHGRIAGFLLGSKGENAHGRVFRENFAALLFAAAKAVLRRPAYLFKILETLFSMVVAPRQRDAAGCGAVLFLAVDGSAQRTGVGTTLINAFEDALRRSGCRCCIVDTMLSTQAPQRFYERRGYRTIKRGWGRVWYRKQFHAGEGGER